MTTPIPQLFIPVNTAPSTLILYLPCQGGHHFVLAGAGPRLGGRDSRHLLRMLPSLHSNSLWVFAPPFMLESIPIIPHHPCCDGKQHPVQDAILYFQHPNHINKVLHGLLQIREIKANFLPHPSSNIAVPSWPDDSKPPQSPQLLSKVTLLNAR